MTLAAWGVRLSVRLYRGLLIAYPAAFRRTYGPDMAQVFRDCCRDSTRRVGGAGLLALWSHTLGDLATSGWRERVAAVAPSPAVLHLEGGPSMSKPGRIARLLPYPLIFLLGLGVSYLNLHTDETPFVALPLLAGAALIGLHQPPRGLALGAVARPLARPVRRVGRAYPYEAALSEQSQRPLRPLDRRPPLRPGRSLRRRAGPLAPAPAYGGVRPFGLNPLSSASPLLPGGLEARRGSFCKPRFCPWLAEPSAL